MIALVDCNSFYASAEQIFRPDLRGKVVVVLSNNDGFIVARSKEAKAIGIPDLEPFFKVKPLLQKHDAAIFSSNYPLYGDISNRVMGILSQYAPTLEVYSIDEMFIDLQGITFDLNTYGRKMKNTLWQHVRMPVGVGIAPSKTLAKIANRAAKDYEHCRGVCVLDTPKKWEWLLKRTKITKVWGIANRLGNRLEAINIHTAYDLATSNPKVVRRRTNINIERTIAELNGVPCFTFSEQPPAKKQIYCTRSFRNKVTKLEPLLQAISVYAGRAAEKLRKQKHLVLSLHVFINTSPFEPNYYSKSMVIKTPYPTDETNVIIHTTKEAVRALFKPGNRYMKAGVGLIELISKANQQLDIFHPGQSKKGEKMMRMYDTINHRFGRNSVYFAAEGVQKKWGMRQLYCSPSYTTRWSDLPKIKL